MNKRIVFTGGGTGGHVFPGLAVAERLQELGGYDLYWMGSRKGIEYAIVQRWGLPFIGIPAGKLRRYFSLQNAVDFFKVGAAMVASIVLLLRYRPDLVFSKGGYVTVPPVFAARLLRIPVVTHDSDIDPGLATRLNARVADRICVPYEQSRGWFPAAAAARLRVTGNPVRAEILQGDRQRFLQMHNLDTNTRVVFVQGGSQGAEEINTLLTDILPQLLPHAVVVHQTGESGIETARSWLQEHPDWNNRYLPREFFTNEYADVLAAADLSVSRAGAGSLWELAATGTPGIILPLTAGSRGDQVRNAELFADSGMITLLNRETRTSRGMLAAVLELLQNGERLRGMQEAAARFEAGQGVTKLIAVCEEVLCS
ncbi:undecaprenyldiphospho-muramoylpentapeptide beta-N-acetylglucosaminyltransferase [Spirochaeta africana]|uniref:UDP-N-acetylglucosamine--N-acetylmuramyl-(pentapeptide) pyrophosphoryl-undecaprenol N-acetylglucosamine transferase n=1 Tax=Spirochaeta africana (strain ATCC 700263 / DSM 8902 / Z-7692) TaxID=889378 RepID=H9UGP6_SPIAZ|nr:undecaprenyldiphospho-muramoylpentapeptide beta-N-acetylglucosaminyltransferase [Spirochaeta africana]AFG36689.1 undecaprenyldiphospho-muramoylpentapeptide beta-N-acetylglucosaminyltransferase [Spirochaeta africana DSM 8902]